MCWPACYGSDGVEERSRAVTFTEAGQGHSVVHAPVHVVPVQHSENLIRRRQQQQQTTMATNRFAAAELLLTSVRAANSQSSMICHEI